MRARIQEVAEEHFRRIGHHKTSVADIASELGMSRANIYRFFPSRDAIKESICRRVLNGTAELALTMARRSTPPSEKLQGGTATFAARERKDGIAAICGIHRSRELRFHSI